MDKPDVNAANEDPRFWEDKLKEQLLGEEQLGLVETPSEPEPTKGRRVSNRKNRDIEILETLLDKDDQFITGSQISKIRTEEKETPDWAFDNAQIREKLLEVFPKLGIDHKQRARAARWAAAIYMFYRLGMTYSQVAQELNITPIASNRLLARISDAFKGLQASGKNKPRGLRKRGRPRKNGGTTETLPVGQGEQGVNIKGSSLY